MYLIIYDSTLQLIGSVDKIKSLLWIRKNTECGTFELVAPVDDNNLSLLQKYNIIQKYNDKEIAYINSINITDNENGAIIKASGLFYSGVLGQRCVKTNETKNLKSLIEENLRGLSLISVPESAAEITYDNDFIGENLMDCITYLAKADGFGFKTILDKANNKVIFNIYYGLDKSIHQTENPRCIFSDSFENLSESEYTDSDVGVINTVYVVCGDLPENCEVPSSIPSYSTVDGAGITMFEKYYVAEPVTFISESDNKTYLDYDATLATMKHTAAGCIAKTQNNFIGKVSIDRYKYKTVDLY